MGLWLILGFVFLLVFQLSETDYAPTALAVSVFVNALFIAFAWEFFHVQRALRPEADDRFMSERAIELTADGISEVGPLTDSFTRWAAVREAKETAKHLFLFLDNRSAHIIPKRSFSDPEELAAFTAIVAANVKPN